MKLAKREKYLVYGTICAVTIFLLFELLVSPFFEKKEWFERGIREKEGALKEILALSADYQTYNKRMQETQKAIANRKKGFTLFSFLEKAASKVGVKDYIKYMKPSVLQGTGTHKKSFVEMKLEKITLKQLVGYLYRIELQKSAVSIESVSIRENKRETGHLDAVLKVFTAY